MNYRFSCTRVTHIFEKTKNNLSNLYIEQTIFFISK